MPYGNAMKSAFRKRLWDSRSLFPSAICTGSERHVTGALAHSVSGPAMHRHRGAPVARRVLMQDVTPKAVKHLTPMTDTDSKIKL